MLAISVIFEFLLSLSTLRQRFFKALQKKSTSKKTWKMQAMRREEGAVEGAAGLFPQSGVASNL
jgi:hypothetical protein